MNNTSNGRSNGRNNPKFTDLGLIDPLLQAVRSEGYDTPTPVQAQAIPPALAGTDILGVAQTGTGKTAAFTLPVLQRLSLSGRRPQRFGARSLIVTPTRELAIQIGESVKTYGRHLNLKHAVVYGGVGQNPQVNRMRKGVDVLIATPGRLLDLIGQGYIQLDRIEIFVLDEADRMLDMGFINDVRKIIREIPKSRHTMLFSATMPKAITSLASSVLKNYERIEISPEETTAERVTQRVLFVSKSNKRDLLHELFDNPEMKRAIVFTRTKHGANKLTKYLSHRGIDADAIHGNKSQSARQRALKGFSNGRTRALVATDVASRGIDVDDITHVVNFDLPNEPESYVHRIGRTARAGAEGMALSFCDHGEIAYLQAIERTIREKVEMHDDHGFHDEGIASGRDSRQGGQSGGRSSRKRSSNGRSGRRSSGGRNSRKRSNSRSR